jgi:NAD(P)-dependent dehydrogenase (short-subunit alcohol dehydrogenase family)
MRLDGRTAVVTGGASGIGAASAFLLADHGARIAILDINDEGAEAAAAEINRRAGSAIAIHCDVAVELEVESAFRTLTSVLGPVDVLLNCAGVAMRRTVADECAGDWDHVLAVNLRGCFLCAKHALANFAERGGSIIHISSVAGITGLRSRAAYSASKGAVAALTRNMAMDYASRNVRVNSICPGFVRTPFINPLLNDPDRLARVTALHPLGRIGEPEDIANAVLFLASDASSWLTGQCIAVDGGLTAGHADLV